MAEIADSIVVRAPVETTFRYVADYSHALEWMDGMAEFTLLGDRATGVGAHVRATHYVLGLAVSVELRIVEFVENEKLVSASSGPVRSTSTWSFEVVEGGHARCVPGRLPAQWAADDAVRGRDPEKRSCRPHFALAAESEGEGWSQRHIRRDDRPVVPT